MNWSRKRIRGLRRHFRNLRQRATKPSELRLVDLEWLARFQQTYHTVLTGPWAGCKEVPRKLEFRALWVARFLRTFPHWHAQLAGRYPTFYLAIWLYEPTDEAFCQSRIMVAVNERRLLYENLFDAAQAIPLPVEYMAVPGMKTLHWQAHPQVLRYTPEAFAQAGPRLANKPYKLGETKQGEPCLFVQVGWVWVGQAPNQ